MASDDIIIRMGMDASDFNKGLQTSRKNAESESKAMSALEKAIKDHALERMTVSEKIVEIRKRELELINQAFTAEAAGNKAGAATASLNALNLKIEREKLITQEKSRQVQIEKQLADETKRVSDATAKQAASEAKFRADLSERVRMEKQSAGLRHAAAVKPSAMSGVMSGIGDAATSVAGALGITIGLAAVVGWVERVSERMVALRRQAEDLGASMTFTAGLSSLERQFDAPAGSATKALQVLVEQIGKARTEGGDAMEKFEKFGISLYDANGTARSGEAVFKDVSTAIANASDASTRAAISFAFFGKAGREVNNILAMGGDELDGFVKSQGKSEMLLQEQAKNWEQIRSSVKGASESAGDYVSKVAHVARFFKTLTFGILTGDIKGQLAVMHEELKPDKKDEGTKKRDEETARLANQKKLAEDLASIAKEKASFQYDQLEGEEKIAALDNKLIALYEKLKGLKDGTLEHEKTELEFLKKNAEWRELINKRVEAGAKVDEEANKKQIEFAQQMLADVNKFTTRKAELEGRVADVESSRADRTKFTLAELAGGNLRGISDPKLRADIIGAREAARLAGVDGKGGLAEQARMRGNTAEAERLQSRADQIKAGLSNLKSSELTSIALDIAKVNVEVHKFNETAANGFKVFPVMGK